MIFGVVWPGCQAHLTEVDEASRKESKFRLWVATAGLLGSLRDLSLFAGFRKLRQGWFLFFSCLSWL